jgi:hypothetical protein
MTMPTGVTTDGVDYLQRMTLLPRLDLPSTAGSPESRRILRVRGVGRPEHRLPARLRAADEPWRGSATVDDSPWIARGHSREHTYQQDLTEPGDVDDAIAQLVREVLEDVGREGRPAVRLTLKIRYKPFLTKTFSRTLPQPTTDAVVLLAEARALSAKRETGRPIRLLGLRVEMTMPEPDPVERTPIRGRL